MKKLLPLLFVSSALFYSCRDMYRSVVDMSVITEKTTYKNLSAVKEPIVINMPVFEEKYLFGNSNNASQTRRIGDMFVIIDWETNSVYDWVYYGGEAYYTFDRPVEVGKNPVKYFSSMSGSGKVACLDPDKTTVSVKETGKSGMFYNRFTPGKYCIKDYARYSEAAKKVEFCIWIYDTENGTYSDKDLSVALDNYEIIPMLASDSSGNFWFSYMLDGFGYIAKVDCANGKIEKLNTTIDCRNEEDSSKADFSAKVRFVFNDYIFIYKGVGSGNHSEDELCIVDFNLDKVAGTISSFLSKDEFIYNVVEVNNSFYGISCNANNENVNFYKLDTENLTSEKVNDEPFQVDITDNAWVRENRIYLMSSRSTRNVYYNYFDVETKETGEGWHVKQSEIVGF